jgi:Uncharacterised nucleotidyltransferase
LAACGESFAVVAERQPDTECSSHYRGAQVNSTNLRPEAALLLACIDMSSTPEEKSARINHVLQQPIDWDYFTCLVMTNGMASMTCAHLKSRVGPGRVPAEIYAGLRYWDASNAKSTDQITEELASIMSRFEAAQIPAIALKGPALSQLAYANIFMRNSSDLDILVRPVDVTVAAELLISAGFRSRTYNREAFTSGFFRNTSDDFTSESARAPIDLHWQLSERYFPFGPDEDGLWSRTETVLLNGREVRTLGAGDHLLFLCAHASKHGWRNLISVVDIAALLNARPALDLCALIEDAARLRFRRMLLLGLSLSHRLAGGQLNNHAITIIARDNTVRKLSDQFSARLVSQAHPQSVLNIWLAAAGTLDSRYGKFQMFAAHTLRPISDDYANLPLPRTLYHLYYVIRPLRLTAKAASTIAKLAWTLIRKRG